MNKHLNIIILLVLIFCFSCNLKDKNYSKKLKQITKDYKKYSVNELIKLGTFKWNSNSTPIYNLEGNLVDGKVYQNLISINKIKSDFYFDENDKMILVVMIPLSKEELDWNEKKSITLLNQQAPDFELTNLIGEIKSLNQFNEKVIVLNFWFTTCQPCIKEIADLNILAEEYKNKEVVFISIAKNKKNEVVKFLKKNKFIYDIYLSNEEILKIYSINSYPTNIVIDKTLKIVYYEKGLRSNIFEEMKKVIDTN